MKIDGRYLRNRRMELGYSLKDLSDLVGISTTMISRYENCIVTNVDTKIVDKFTNALKCDILDISFTGDMLQCPVCKHKIISNLVNNNSLSYVVCNYCNYVMYFKNSKLEVK